MCQLHRLGNSSVPRNQQYQVLTCIIHFVESFIPDFKNTQVLVLAWFDGPRMKICCVKTIM